MEKHHKSRMQQFDVFSQLPTWCNQMSVICCKTKFYCIFFMKLSKNKAESLICCLIYIFFFSAKWALFTRWQEGKRGHSQCWWPCGCSVCGKWLWLRKEQLGLSAFGALQWRLVYGLLNHVRQPCLLLHPLLKWSCWLWPSLLLHFLSVCWLIVLAHETHHGPVTGKLNVHCCAVASQQSEQQ